MAESRVVVVSPAAFLSLAVLAVVTGALSPAPPVVQRDEDEQP